MTSNNPRIFFTYDRRSVSPLAFLWTGVGGLTDIGTLGGSWSFAMAVSADGRAVAGNSTKSDYLIQHAFRWTPSDGMVDLGALDGDFSYAYSISSDGRTVVGFSGTTADGKTPHAFRWTTTDGMQDLGSLGGWTTAYAVSADGGVVVGESWIPGSLFHAFRWTPSEGMVDLGTLPGGNASTAIGVSADGRIVVGDASDSDGGMRAFRWTQVEGMRPLGPCCSNAVGLSSDGSVVVGNAWNADSNHAFRWTEAGGMVDLGSLGGFSTLSSGGFSQAAAVSADGRVVVGSSVPLVDSYRPRGFRWTQASEMQSVEDWLRANGVTVADDITVSAFATNSDGSVVVGHTWNDLTYVARVSGLGRGLITLSDMQQSLGASATVLASTAINGAHSRPLSRRIAAGQRTFWLAGDWGRDDHGSRSGNLGLAEAGLGYNFGPLQTNVSLGQTWSKQSLTLDGRANVDATYIQAEALVPVAGNLWATLGAYASAGDAELRRGYLNAGNPDFSTAGPGIKVSGLRARLDWDNAFNAASIDFSPYADLTYSETKMDAYTETGGGFPARFDARKEKASESRLGVGATYRLSGEMLLLGMLEMVHRFEKSGARTSGEVLGMFEFDLAGQRNKQDWLRLGAGIEGPLADGKASLSLNATTQGSAPNLWLAANWQVAF